MWKSSALRAFFDITEKKMFIDSVQNRKVYYRSSYNNTPFKHILEQTSLVSIKIWLIILILHIWIVRILSSLITILHFSSKLNSPPSLKSVSLKLVPHPHELTSQASVLLRLRTHNLFQIRISFDCIFHRRIAISEEIDNPACKPRLDWYIYINISNRENIAVIEAADWLNIDLSAVCGGLNIEHRQRRFHNSLGLPTSGLENPPRIYNNDNG